MTIFKRKPLLSDSKTIRFFSFRNPLFWIVMLLLLVLGSVWLTFIRVIDWLHAIATR